MIGFVDRLELIEWMGEKGVSVVLKQRESKPSIQLAWIKSNRRPIGLGIKATEA